MPDTPWAHAPKPPTPPRPRPGTTATPLVLLAALLAALLLALVGCGPGVGGTGTGSDGAAPDAQATARPADVCAADFAALLACTSSGGAVASPGVGAGAGTALVVLAEAYPLAQVQARISGQALQLDLRCDGLQFLGEWGDSPALGLRWYGQVQPNSASKPSTAAMAATATLRAEGSVWWLTLLDGQGRVLAGPHQLQRVPGDTTAAACR